MTEVCDALCDNLLTCDESLIHRVTPGLMALCITKLKSGKSDGNKGFTSDHLNNSGTRLCILTSLLFKSILFHGYPPHELLLSTIVSIPKDIKSSLSSADNYRGISLSILLQRCLIMLLFKYLAAVCKLPICNLLIKQNILQHYAPWFILILCITKLIMVVTCIAVC